MSMTDYIDKRYDETFASVYEELLDMAAQDPEQAEKHIRKRLKSLYIRQGNDWTGSYWKCRSGCFYCGL